MYFLIEFPVCGRMIVDLDEYILMGAIPLKIVDIYFNKEEAELEAYG